MLGQPVNVRCILQSPQLAVLGSCMQPIYCLLFSLIGSCIDVPRRMNREVEPRKVYSSASSLPGMRDRQLAEGRMACCAACRAYKIVP